MWKGMKVHVDAKEKKDEIQRIRRNSEFIITEQRLEKENRKIAQMSYREKKLFEILANYIKIHIRKQAEAGVSLEDIINSFSDEGVIKSIIGKAKLEVSITDTRVQRNNISKKEDKLLINPKKTDLANTLNRFYPEVVGDVCKEYINQEKENIQKSKKDVKNR